MITMDVRFITINMIIIHPGTDTPIATIIIPVTGRATTTVLRSSIRLRNGKEVLSTKHTIIQGKLQQPETPPIILPKYQAVKKYQAIIQAGIIIRQAGNPPEIQAFQAEMKADNPPEIQAFQAEMKTVNPPEIQAFQAEAKASNLPEIQAFQAEMKAGNPPEIQAFQAEAKADNRQRQRQERRPEIAQESKQMLPKEQILREISDK
jgi:hypothetical protein